MSTDDTRTMKDIMSTYHAIYTELHRLTEGFTLETARWETGSTAFMPLCVEHLGGSRYSVTHYYEQNGDLCSDPDMTFRLAGEAFPPSHGLAEALTYQDSFGYKEVYPEPGKVYPRLKKELNAFAVQWFQNIRAQGYKIVKRNGEQVAA